MVCQHSVNAEDAQWWQQRQAEGACRERVVISRSKEIIVVMVPAWKSMWADGSDGGHIPAQWYFNDWQWQVPAGDWLPVLAATEGVEGAGGATAAGAAAVGNAAAADEIGAESCGSGGASIVTAGASPGATDTPATSRTAQAVLESGGHLLREVAESPGLTSVEPCLGDREAVNLKVETVGVFARQSRRANIAGCWAGMFGLAAIMAAASGIFAGGRGRGWQLSKTNGSSLQPGAASSSAKLVLMGSEESFAEELVGRQQEETAGNEAVVTEGAEKFAGTLEQYMENTRLQAAAAVAAVAAVSDGSGAGNGGSRDQHMGASTNGEWHVARELAATLLRAGGSEAAGQLTYKQFRNAAKILWGDGTDQEATDMYRDMDLNADGTVAQDELLNYWAEQVRLDGTGPYARSAWFKLWLLVTACLVMWLGATLLSTPVQVMPP